MEFIVAEIEGGIDGFEWFKVDVDLSFFPLRSDDFSAVDDKAIGRDLIVELQALLGGGDGRQDRETIDPGLDVGSGSKFFRQHSGSS